MAVVYTSVCYFRYKPHHTTSTICYDDVLLGAAAVQCPFIDLFIRATRIIFPPSLVFIPFFALKNDI